MSRGPGSVQRKILNLIAAEPNGAWTIGKLCREVYGQRVTKVQRVAERVAVGRALRRMTLPSTWTVRSSGGKNWLCDPCNLQSMKIAYPWHPDHFKPGGIIYEMVERAKRYRDGTPLERLTMDIEDAQKQCSYERELYGTQSPESVERLGQVNEQRDKLLAVAA